MKPFLLAGNLTSFAMSANSLPQWLAVLSLVALIAECVLWAESEKA